MTNNSNKESKEIEVSNASASAAAGDNFQSAEQPIQDASASSSNNPQAIPIQTEQTPTSEQKIAVLNQQLQIYQIESTNRTIFTIDYLDKILNSLHNVSALVMNIREEIKTNQLGLNQPPQNTNNQTNNNQQSQQQSPA